ncbi:polyketide synthase dehydratase domain-containing protein, partial [Thermoactinomyces sp. CICC 10523]|uniref:polyketide synthase dehydratase domain-containing protein n=1 Tax=Thermoactinomyces sp. CICC 10523 TaxID=2767428 RepID=UPI0018DD35B8
YSGKKPGRMSLPTYPFARQRCWIPAEERKERPLTGTVLHPLLHRNTSDLYEQRFSSVFTGEEFFLSDHLVGGKRVLPGSACLEMARAAVDQAVGGWTGEGKGIRLRQVNWLRPVVAGEQPVEVHIGLIAENENEIAYEVYSETDAGEEVVHSEGTAELMTDAVPPVLDLEAVKGECSRRTLTAEEMYEAFARMGIRYGETHRGIAEVHVGEGQVLARLHLPSAAAEAGKGFHLHPGMVDAAIQAGLGLGIDSGRLEPALPFAVEEVEIYGKTGPAMWARVHQETGGKLSVDLCDETGR